MKKLELIELISRVGRELQSRMTFDEIETFLKAFNIFEQEKTLSGINSKWKYVKEMLAGEPEETVLEIAAELDLIEVRGLQESGKLEESDFWRPHHFRLFISHLASFKGKVSVLQDVLFGYGISGFVAHEDIRPTREWQMEIEKALESMDALVAILMEGFKKSDWTDQEVGFALGRGKLVIPIRRGIDPYGFIGKFQGFLAKDLSIGEVARNIFLILASHEKTRESLADSLVELLIVSRERAGHWLDRIEEFGDLPVEQLKKLKRRALENSEISENQEHRSRINDWLTAASLGPLVSEAEPPTVDDDLPF